MGLMEEVFYKDLEFKHTVNSKRQWLDSKEEAILPSGSTITRVNTRKARIFQLWLNREEYVSLQRYAAYHGIMGFEFYGQNYVYAGPNVSMTKHINGINFK